MRLYPPVWSIGRYVDNDYTLGKYTIPAGSTIMMSQYVMHHDPRYYNEPERFDPERWSTEAKSSLPRFSYFPFGGGIRACIGESFGRYTYHSNYCPTMENASCSRSSCRTWPSHHSTSKVRYEDETRTKKSVKILKSIHSSSSQLSAQSYLYPDYGLVILYRNIKKPADTTCRCVTYHYLLRQWSLQEVLFNLDITI